MGEFVHFLGQARGSLLELDTQLAIALDLEYIETEIHARLECKAFQILGLLNRLIESVQKRRAATTANL